MAATIGTLVHHCCQILAQGRRSVLLGRPGGHRISPEWIFQAVFGSYQRKHAVPDKERANAWKLFKVVIDSPHNPMGLTPIGIERQFAITLTEPRFRRRNGEHLQLRGTIDFVGEVEPPTAPSGGVVELLDYKSGKYRSDWVTLKEKGLEDFYDDIQLLNYHAAIRVLYPQYKHIIGTIFFLQAGGPFTVHFEPEDLSKTLDKLYEHFRRIEDTKVPLRLKDDPARKAQYFKCNYVCGFGPKYLNVCDTHFGRLRAVGAEKAAAAIQLTVNGGPISRRNDYGRAKIARGTLP